VPFEWLLALRYLRARRKESFISVISLFSFLGIMLGVATLIVVMSVLNGFRAELLDKIAANNGQGYNFSLALGDAARPGFSGISLRGLGSNLTLVLLNGRRLAVYAFDGGGVDVNGISLNAIERVEILNAHAYAIEADAAQNAAMFFGCRTRIDFDADLRSGRQGEPLADIAEQVFNLRG